MQSINRWTAACSMVAALAVLPWVSQASAAVSSTTFTNPGAITIPDSGTATPYPSNIDVSGLNGEVIRVTLQLHNVSHTCIGDVSVVLVAPNGTWLPVMTANDPCDSAVNVQLRFADGYPTMADGTISGTYSPNQGGSILAPPGDVCGGGEGVRNGGKKKSARQAKVQVTPVTTFATFNGPGALETGTWSLYVSDCVADDAGAFAGGWSLTFDTEVVNVPTLGEAGLVGLGLLLFGFGARTLRRRA